MKLAANNPKYITDIQSKITRKHLHESALMTAAHILMSLTKEGKSYEAIIREDFNNNLELVSVWIDYMIGIKWISKNIDHSNNNKWVATEDGKKWVEKIVQHIK